ncbi:MAG: hypothetical protein IKA91_03515 [Bacteroidaceae bacterium]|nr:hypothetical protein [Bacteroidaceae bacterium]
MHYLIITPMKHTPFLQHIILALALLLVGCHSDPQQVELIDRAEAVMDSLQSYEKHALLYIVALIRLMLLII